MAKDPLTVAEVAQRSGFAPSALRFYEEKGLIEASRTVGRAAPLRPGGPAPAGLRPGGQQRRPHAWTRSPPSSTPCRTAAPRTPQTGGASPRTGAPASTSRSPPSRRCATGSTGASAAAASPWRTCSLYNPERRHRHPDLGSRPAARAAAPSLTAARPTRVGRRRGIACGRTDGPKDESGQRCSTTEHQRGLHRPPPAGPGGARGGPQAPRHVHRLARQQGPHALPLGDHRQRGRRGAGRRREPHRGRPPRRPVGRGARPGPRHPRRHRAPDRPVRRRGGLHQAARRGQVRRHLLRGDRWPARRRRLGRQRAVRPPRRRGGPGRQDLRDELPARRARHLRRPRGQEPRVGPSPHTRARARCRSSAGRSGG